jgi:hypothetical protein
VSACDGVRVELGGYALGGLTPDERSRVEAHTSGCPTCRAELDELEGAARLLTTLRPPSPPAPADLEHRVLSAHRRGARRRPTWLVAAALVLTAIAGLTVGATFDGRQDAPAPDRVLTLRAEEGDDLRGEAGLRQTPNGVEVRLELTGVAEAGEGYYHLWLHRGDRRVSAGTFVGAAGEARVDLTCGGQLGGYDRLTLTWHPFGGDEVVAVDAELA